jgi:tetratricopeptide (TPR) repeat protein
MLTIHKSCLPQAISLSLVFLLALLGPWGLWSRSAPAQEETPEDLIAQAEELFPERYVPETLDRIISLYEDVLPELDSLPGGRQAFVLNRLAQLYYERSVLSEGDTAEDRRSLEKGKEYGLRSLRLNPDFAEWEERDFDKAVSFVTDPGALLWTADNWGGIFQFDPFAGLTGIGKLITMHRRCLELDETTWGASCHNSLGAIQITTPGFLGGNPDEGRAHLERALELAPDYLTNHVMYAEYWGFTYDALGKKNGVRDRELIEREVQLVLDAPIGEDWPFWNRIAKRDARRLLEELGRFE